MALNLNAAAFAQYSTALRVQQGLLEDQPVRDEWNDPSYRQQLINSMRPTTRERPRPAHLNGALRQVNPAAISASGMQMYDHDKSSFYDPTFYAHLQHLDNGATALSELLGGLDTIEQCSTIPQLPQTGATANIDVIPFSTLEPQLLCQQLAQDARHYATSAFDIVSLTVTALRDVAGSNDWKGTVEDPYGFTLEILRQAGFYDSSVVAPNPTFDGFDRVSEAPNPNYEYKPVEALLFIGEPRSVDIIQGTIGDCWLLATMITLVQNDPAAVAEMFKEIAPGIYEVRWRDGTTTVVDNRLAFTGTYDFVAAEMAETGALWPMILEKAYAVRFGNGNYVNLWGGLPGHALEDLTGREAVMFGMRGALSDRPVPLGFLDPLASLDISNHVLPFISAGLLDGYIPNTEPLENYLEANDFAPMILATGSTVPEPFVPFHTYAVLYMFTHNGVDYLTIQNPHDPDLLSHVKLAEVDEIFASVTVLS